MHPFPMTTKSQTIPDTLNQHLSAASGEDLPSITAYLDRGADLVTPDALAALLNLRPALRSKIVALDNSEVLRRRLELLATYFEETCDEEPADRDAQREVAFALLYFLKGFDRIPDNVPEVGLLDDAMIVQTVLQRHATTLRAHWLRHRRIWPADALVQ